MIYTEWEKSFVGVNQYNHITSAFPLVEIDVTILNISLNQWNVFFCSDRIR